VNTFDIICPSNFDTKCVHYTMEIHFIIRWKNKVIENFTQHLPNDSWIRYFWTYYFQFGMWLSSPSIKLSFHRVVHIRKFPFIELRYKYQWSTRFPCGYYVICCRFVDGGVYQVPHSNQKTQTSITMGHQIC